MELWGLGLGLGLDNFKGSLPKKNLTPGGEGVGGTGGGVKYFPSFEDFPRQRVC